MSEKSSRTLASSLNKLNISQSPKSAPKIKKAEPVESWEDEAASDSDSSNTETGSPAGSPVGRVTSSDYPGAPPPTPASPSFSSRTTAQGAPFQTFPPFGMDSSFDSDPRSQESSPARNGGGDKRPEKSTAVASRLIAAGIGQSAPKRTKEQRDYDRALKLQEKKRRDQAKEDEIRKQKEKEKALKDVWGD